MLREKLSKVNKKVKAEKAFIASLDAENLLNVSAEIYAAAAGKTSINVGSIDVSLSSFQALRRVRNIDTKREVLFNILTGCEVIKEELKAKKLNIYEDLIKDGDKISYIHFFRYTNARGKETVFITAEAEKAFYDQLIFGMLKFDAQDIDHILNDMDALNRKYSEETIDSVKTGRTPNVPFFCSVTRAASTVHFVAGQVDEDGYTNKYWNLRSVSNGFEFSINRKNCEYAIGEFAEGEITEYRKVKITKNTELAKVFMDDLGMIQENQAVELVDFVNIDLVKVYDQLEETVIEKCDPEFYSIVSDLRTYVVGRALIASRVKRDVVDEIESDMNLDEAQYAIAHNDANVEEIGGYDEARRNFFRITKDISLLEATNLLKVAACYYLKNGELEMAAKNSLWILDRIITEGLMVSAIEEDAEACKVASMKVYGRTIIGETVKLTNGEGDGVWTREDYTGFLTIAEVEKVDENGNTIYDDNGDAKTVTEGQIKIADLVELELAPEKQDAIDYPEAMIAIKQRKYGEIPSIPEGLFIGLEPGRKVMGKKINAIVDASNGKILGEYIANSPEMKSLIDDLETDEYIVKDGFIYTSNYSYYGKEKATGTTTSESKKKEIEVI